MKDSVHDDAAGPDIGLHGQQTALQVVCLGSGGGPSEENVTGFLVRSVGSEWAKGSMLAVDAGSHLAPITRILEKSFPSISGERRKSFSNGRHTSNGDARLGASTSPLAPAVSQDEAAKFQEPVILSSGPFAGLKCRNESARANALDVIRTYVSTYLITHPHLDHLSGFAINTAAFHATSRPKTLAALPSTVDAIKEHIFNDVIWPNLSDEDGGVGFVTFQRLKEGGDLMVGEGEGRGYIDVCDGLGVRAFKVSHGTCTKSPPSHHHRGSVAGISDSQPPYNGSIQGTSQPDAGSVGMNRSLSISHLNSAPGTPGGTQRQSFHYTQPSPQIIPSTEHACVVDSTAYFLRDEYTQREVLIFGDVEPDSISLSPRNRIVWQEAARKIAFGVLGGIFIECSYDDSQADALLFGHLNPKHLIAELQTLASFVNEAKAARDAERANKKRKRSGPNGLDAFAQNPEAVAESERKRSRSLVNRRRGSVPGNGILPEAFSLSTPPPGDGITHSTDGVASPRSVNFAPSTDDHSDVVHVGGDAVVASSDTSGLPLYGLRVIIIHIKDTLRDGPHVSESILQQLNEHEARLQMEGAGLGCEFIISQSGESYMF